ncbi:aminotransferase class I/II-fold pyridoxal phosphate-dependent enzyme [Alteromonas sp. 1_MG-2023]|uniref:aminotransferase class I/II-fold pyridoxal phosphate-dependent enzyme n=1 Tax=Alteromonas sp. 1_MG-2023 TaxID=3062669 RepID=UPI0026E17775|nr:aminotransferase class I/II-fold pyridoxal phosphate-dependent enzyme [Alteromonas sp. 1_MG-2023]MDO6567696.1 aminotransferase class I/II-fold pyridoxal phosphate-dependent enzyme [Alteromonas sp. 1_MG-2023]
MLKYASRATTLSPFLAMAYGEKATALSNLGHDVIRLNLGEPDFGAPTPVVEAMKQSLSQADYPYTSALGLPELRSAIAQFYKSQHNVDIPASRIVVTAGASAALLLVSAALVENGDKVILGDPSYPCNRRFLNTFGGEVTLVPTSSEQQFQLTHDDVTHNWDSKTKGVLIASPANPTGTAIAQEELYSIGETCKQNDGFLIVDEIYLNLDLGIEDTSSSTNSVTNSVKQAPLNTVLANETLHSNTIVINSFSKYFGMTGWRLGWCVVPEGMTHIMERLAQNLFICPSTLAQQAALACFTPESLAQCEQKKAQLRARATFVLQAIADMGLSIDATPDGAFYAYINIERTGLTAVEFCDRLLAEEYVALTPGDDFGDHNATRYVRLSFATEISRLKEGLTRMKRFVETCTCE